MKAITDTLLSIRRTVKLYDRLLKDVCERYGLTLIEANILSFLYNNPGLDTAADIVELRGLHKGNVSAGVEALMQKSLLSRRQDDTDRRRIHLSLTPQAGSVTQELEQCRRRFFSLLFNGFTPEEQALYEQLTSRVMDNTRAGLQELTASSAPAAPPASAMGKEDSTI